MVTASDGDAIGGDGIDRIRIRIWNTATGTAVYDNQLGGADTEDPTTALTGGSVVVHAKKR